MLWVKRIRGSEGETIIINDTKMQKRDRKRVYDKVLTEHSEGHEYNPSDKVGIELEL